MLKQWFYVKRSAFLGRTIHPTCCSEVSDSRTRECSSNAKVRMSIIHVQKKGTVLSFHRQHMPKHNCAFIFIAPRSMKCSPEDMCSGWEEGQKWAQGVHKVKRAGQGSRLKMDSHVASHEVRTPSDDSAIILLCYLHLVEETKKFCRGATIAPGKVWSFPSAFHSGL